MKTIIKNTMVDPIEMTCDECQSVFSYNYQDIELEKEYPIFSLCARYTRFVACPVCKHRIDMDRVEIRVEKEETDNTVPCLNCKHFFKEGMGHCTIHPDCYGDCICDDYKE